jgi:F-type H+-transporting ATPase subunit b
MPQFSQLTDVVLSQLFWLALVLGFIYFVIGRGMLPKIQSTVDQRDQKIADDLAAAERAKVEADESEEAFRLRMDESRAEAMKTTAAAKAQGAKAIEQKVAKADASIQAKLAKAEEAIRASRQEALANIEGVAAELAQDIAGKVAGLKVSRDDAAKAVKAELTHG